MQLMSRSATFLTLTAVAILLAAAPAPAQPGQVSHGQGTYFAADQVTILHFAYHLTEKGNGSTQGVALWQGPLSTTVFRITSFMYAGDTLLMAGPIIASAGSPPPGFAVGATVFTGFNDNGPGSADETLSLSVVPAQFGNPTIQQIVALIGPPAPSDFRLLQSGNVWIR